MNLEHVSVESHMATFGDVEIAGLGPRSWIQG
jgi:hypothetical protein